jgi:hypothetical protein
VLRNLPSESGRSVVSGIPRSGQSLAVRAMPFLDCDVLRCFDPTDCSSKQESTTENLPQATFVAGRLSVAITAASAETATVPLGND